MHKARFVLISLLIAFSSVVVQAQNWVWDKQVAGLYNQEGTSVSFQNWNNVFFSGVYKDTSAIAADTLPFHPKLSSYLLSTNQNGTKNWIKTFSGDSDVTIEKITSDVFDNVYASGHFYSSFYSDSDTFFVKNNPPVVHQEVFVMKLNAAGNLLWFKHVSPIEFKPVQLADISSRYNLILCGTTTDIGIFISGDTLMNVTDSLKIFIASIHSSTDTIVYFIQSSGNPIGKPKIIARNNNEVYMAGQFNNWICFGNDTLFAPGISGFLAHFNWDGYLFSLKQIETSCNIIPTDLSIWGDSILFITGSACGTITYDSTSAVADSLGDVFVLKTDMWGNFRKISVITGSGSEEGISIRTQQQDSTILIAGNFNDTIFIDSLSLVSQGNQSGFLLAFDQNMKLQGWLLATGDSSVQFNDMDKGWQNEGYVTGSFDKNVNLTVDSFLSEGMNDGFIAKFGCNLPLIPVTVQNNQFCPGDSAKVSFFPVPGFNYLWYDSLIDTVRYFDTALSVWLEAKNMFGCWTWSNYISIIEDPIPPPVISFYPSQVLCEGDTIYSYLTNVFPDLTYTWSNGFTGDTMLIDSSISFSVFATDTNGCSSLADSVLVTEIIINEPGIYSTDSLLCNNDTVTVFYIPDPNPDYSYWWFDLFESDSLNIFTAQSVYLTAYNYSLSGWTCYKSSDTLQISVAVQQPWIETWPSSQICLDDTVWAYIGNESPDLTYTWSTGFVGNILPVDSPVVLTVTASDTTGCSVISNPYTIIDALPVLPVIQTDSGLTFCKGDSTALFVYKIPNVLLTWSNGENDTLIYVHDNSYVYVFATTEATCIYYSDTFIVTEIDSLTIQISSSLGSMICDGEVTTLSVFPFPTAVQFLWSNGFSGTSQPASQPDTFSVLVTDSFGCLSQSDTFFLAVDYPLPIQIFSSGDTIICEDSSVVLLTDTIYNAYTYLWSQGSSTSSVTIDYSGNFYLTGTDTNGCFSVSNTLQVMEAIIPKPQIVPGGGLLYFCDGDSLILSITPQPGLIYQWSTGSNDTLLVANKPEWYYVVSSDTNGCSKSSDSVLVTESIPVAPQINFDGTPVICPGNSFALWVSPLTGYTYTWSNNTTGDSVFLQTGGDYYLYATDSAGCIALSDTVTVEKSQLAQPFLNSVENAVLCYGDTLTLFINNPDNWNYQWSNGDTNLSITVNTSGTYFVKANDSLGCILSSDSLEVFILSAVPLAKLKLDCDSLYSSPDLSQYRWYLNDSLLLNESLPFIIIEKSGQYYLIGLDSNGCMVYSDTLQTAISEKLSAIKVFPNPATDAISISIPRSNNTSLNVEVHSLYGQEIKKTYPVKPETVTTEKGGCKEGNNTITVPLDLSGYGPGIYMILIKGKDIQWTYKIVKIN